MKSPLKSNIDYKSTAALKKMIAPESTVSSFFLYAAHLELALSNAGHTIVAHTNKKAVYEFWATALQNPSLVAYTAKNVFPTLLPAQLTLLQETWTNFKYPEDRAAMFFILNRCSESGWVSSGRIDRHNFNAVSLSHLNTFHADRFFPFFDDTEDPLEGLASATATDYILLPMGQFGLNLFEYGKNKGPEMAHVNHRQVARQLKEIERRWIVIYKSHPTLFTTYGHHNITMIDAYGRPTNEKARCEELIIANF